MLNPRTRTVLRLMLITSLRSAWSLIKTLMLLVAVLTYVLGSFSVNLFTKAWLEAAWPLRHTAVALWPAGLWLGTVITGSMSVVTVVVFWSFCWLHRKHPLSKSPDPLIDRWWLGLPKPDVDHRSSWWHLLVAFGFCALYMANAAALLASFVLLLLIRTLASLALPPIAAMRKAWLALRTPLPGGGVVPVRRRVWNRLIQLWDRQAQRLLDANPGAYVEAEQQVLHDVLDKSPTPSPPPSRTRL